MLTFIVTTPINHVLRSEHWACRRLQSFAGKTIGIRVPPLVNFSMLIDAAGEMQQVDSPVCADTTLTLSPLILPRLLAQESSAFELIKITGDQSLADELIKIGKQINFNVIIEDDLSKAIGDIPAHRITQASEHFMQWQAGNVHRISRAIAEYCTEESGFLTKPAAIEQFAHDVQNLQLDTEQLEQRLNRLTR
jgi:ubiquinone biosynthesis protein UbiJ